jgi:hypothetical protein
LSDVTDAELSRDLAADLKLCGDATPGPWLWHSVLAKGYMNQCLISDTDPDDPTPILDCYCPDVASVYSEEIAQQMVEFLPDEDHNRWCPFPEDAAFIAASREGWPAAIRRAMTAEAECERLRAELAAERAARRAAEWAARPFVPADFHEERIAADG